MKNYDILLADDHVMFRQGIKRVIEESDDLKIVGEVGNGLELLEFLKNRPVDMVILDISMPGMRGTELTQRLLAIRPDLPIILCSGYNSKISPEEIDEIGLKRFIAKPLSLETLAFSIENVLTSKTRTSS